jgi:hypothetical protein
MAAAGIAFDMPEQDSDSDSDDSADVARGDAPLSQQTDAQVLLLLLLSRYTLQAVSQLMLCCYHK